MVGDMICRIGTFLLNVSELVLLEKIPDSLEQLINVGISQEDFIGSGEIILRVILKGGSEKFIKVSQKEFDSIVEYFNAVCPDLTDDFTRKTMIQHIFNQRTSVLKKMADDGLIPKTDFPEQMTQARGGLGRKP